MANWEKATSEQVKEIVREGELYLAAQVQLATSADQRASVMAGIFTAAGGAVIAALISIVAANKAAEYGAVFAGGGIAAVLFLLGAGACVWATLPVGFNLPGSQPESWEDDVTNQREFTRSLGEQAKNYQEKINDNRKVLGANAARFRLGAIAGIAAPAAGFLVWLATSYGPDLVCR